MDIENFIYNLNTSNLLIPGKFTTNQLDGITTLIQALVFIVPAIFYFYNYYRIKKRVKFNDLNDIEKYINNAEFFKTMSFLFQGLVYIYLAIRLYYFFKPSNSQITIGILIKYLQKKKIISDEFYKIIKRLKPEGMNTFGEL